MRKTLGFIVVLCCLSSAWTQPFGIYQHGTVVRMQMADCMPVRHGFVANMGGGAQVLSAPDSCPEYTLVSDKVVYLIVGTSSNQLIPLADVIDFRIYKSEIAVRVDDAKREIKFNIKEMTLRGEWDLIQKHMVDQLSSPARLNASPTATDNTVAKQDR